MDLGEIEGKMRKAVEYTRGDVAMIRTGRANRALVENIMVNTYGGTAKLKVVELGTLNVPDARTIVVTPYDQSIIGDIRRDIEAANIGITPVIDKNLIRITFPPLSAERRMELVRLLHRKLEEGRVKVRQIRHEKMSELKEFFEERVISEDDRHRLEKQLQELTDKMMEAIETIGQAKETELMTV